MAGYGEAAKKNEGKANGYTLWFAPSGEAREKLAIIISSLARKFGGPVLKPHVTLISGLAGNMEDIAKKSSELALSIRPFKISLNDVDGTDRYFRCIFIRAEKIPELMSAGGLAMQIFGRMNDDGYMPHLSLFYGKLPQKTRKEIIAKIGRNFNLAFKAKSMHLVMTEGEPARWHSLRKFPLTK
jgi:2'-5' RNA ligase